MEFWESSFIEKQTMWGFEPTDAAVLTKDFFLEQNVKDLLIPGIGYGRNAKVFLESGMNVTGIEISKTAIGLARKHGLDIPIHHGSVTEMAIDPNRYDGIFCHGLIHLLNHQDRQKFIKDCYDLLKPNGHMVVTALSKKAPMFGKGKQLADDYFEVMEGVNMFFYDADSVRRDFSDYGLTEVSEIDEPNKHSEHAPSINFLVVKCQKAEFED